MKYCIECNKVLTPDDNIMLVEDDFGFILVHEGCMKNHNNKIMDDYNRDMKFYELLRDNKLVK